MRLSGGARAAALGGTSSLVAAVVALAPDAFYVANRKYLFQSEDGTGDISADGTAVGYMADLSGNGRHVTQSTAGSRPLFKTTGDLSWLQFDGSDDWMRATFAINQPWERISAIRQVAWVSGDRIFGPAATNDRGFLFQSNASPELDLYDGGIAAANTDAVIGSDVVVIERHNGASSRLGVDNGTYATGNAGANNNDGLTIAGDVDSPAAAGSFLLYGVVMFSRLLTDSEISICRTFMGKLQGRTL